MKPLISKNPATGETIATSTALQQADVTNAFDRAKKAFKAWSQSTVQERLQYLERGKSWLMKNQESVVDVICKNNGKPRVEALMSDVSIVLISLTYYINNAEKILSDESLPIARFIPTKRSFLSFSPLGVIGIISPWNYPFSIPLCEVIASLAAGNCVLLKPSEVTGLINKQIQEFINACELPENVFQMLEGDGTAGAALSSLPLQKIIFTGSVATGKKVMRAAAENLVPVALELGGKDPAIVLDDANVDKASSGVLNGSFYNCGQTCASVERLLLHSSIEKEFVRLFNEKTNKLRIGESKNFSNDIGPLTYEPQKTVLLSHLADHSKSMASHYDGQANFMKPVLVKGATGKIIWDEESFGPVVVYDTYETDEEAIQKANNSIYGLGAVIWSSNMQRARNIGRRLEAGNIVINDIPFTNAIPSIPWGGVKHSGIGRVHGKEALRDLCIAKTITYDLLGQRRQPWWFPYTEKQYKLLSGFVEFTVTNSILVKFSRFFGLIKNFLRLERRL